MAKNNDRQDNTGTSPFNRTAQHNAKRTAILSQASKLFNGRGSRSTTLLDIAQSLGLTKTSLYYYVKTKEELIYQCYLASLDSIMAGLDNIERDMDSGLARMQAVMRHHFNHWREAQQGRSSHNAALLEIASLKDQHREHVEQRYTEMFLRIRRFIRDGIQDGSIRPLESSAATLGLIGSMQWSFNYLRTVPMDRFDAVTNGACDLISHGLAGGGANFKFGSHNFSIDNEPPVSGFDRTGQNRLKQEAFYRTGTWFFNRKGFAGTSLDDIAETLRVTKGAFYYHIRNKEDLLYNCYTRSLDILFTIHEAATGLPLGINKLDYMLRRSFHVQNSEVGPMIRYHTITALPLPKRKEILTLTDQSNARFGQYMRDGISDGSVRDIHVEAAQELITGAMNASMDLALWRRVDDIEQASIDYYDMFFGGLAAR